MNMLKTLTSISAVGACVIAFGTAGCSPKPNQEEVTRLQEAKEAAENAERKLAELRRERQELEAQVQQKEGEIKGQQQERDALKGQMGQ